MREIYEGIDVDTWSYSQTMRPRPAKLESWYTGYGLLTQAQWYDLDLPEIPLDIRFRSFSRRLDNAIVRHRTRNI